MNLLYAYMYIHMSIAFHEAPPIQLSHQKAPIHPHRTKQKMPNQYPIAIYTYMKNLKHIECVHISIVFSTHGNSQQPHPDSSTPA